MNFAKIDCPLKELLQSEGGEGEDCKVNQVRRGAGKM